MQTHSTPNQIEARKYEDVWASVDTYGDVSPGERRVPMFLEMSNAQPGDVVLDAGAGSGKGSVALAAAGLQVTMCDITDTGLTDEARELPFVEACLWKSLAHIYPRGLGGKFDYVYCCDVMEHVPPEYTMLVISRMLQVAGRGVFFSIALTPDQMGFWAGHPLHLTVQPFTWWRDHLRDLGELVECRDLLSSGVYFVRPHHGQ